MFKSYFKQYKSKCPPPDFSDVINFSDIKVTDDTIVKEYNVQQVNVPEAQLYGLRPVDEWKVYELVEKPGFLFIPNPFCSQGHRYWVCRCLQDYTSKPDCRLNLDIHGDLGANEDWWEVGQRNDRLLIGLRWATLGYHHNWDTKEYSENARGPFPLDLASVSQLVAQAVGFTAFTAQAAIVNFYHMDSTLSGHTDHSEANRGAPLLSFSFGQSAVFLLGGPTLDDKPTAMFVHSGDVIIMSGESRLCYHGVPRILQTVISPWDVTVGGSFSHHITKHEPIDSIRRRCTDNVFWKRFGDYLETSRININVRQVLYPNQKSLES